MPRKSNAQLEVESALRCLQEIHELALEGEQLGEGCSRVYVRNALDCRRWLRTVRDARAPLPEFITRDLRYFTAIWG